MNTKDFEENQMNTLKEENNNNYDDNNFYTTRSYNSDLKIENKDEVKQINPIDNNNTYKDYFNKNLTPNDEVMMKTTANYYTEFMEKYKSKYKEMLQKTEEIDYIVSQHDKYRKSIEEINDIKKE